MRRGRLTRAALASAGAAGILLFVASPARASLDGPCEGQGVFQSDGQVVDARTQDRITVPDEDDVAYVGTIATAEQNRSHRGAIDLDLPFPLPDVAIADWDTEETDENEDAGTYEYDLPSYVPRGVELHLKGHHEDTAGRCDGSLTVEVDGGVFDAPLATGVAAAGTVLSGLGLVLSGRIRTR